MSKQQNSWNNRQAYVEQVQLDLNMGWQDGTRFARSFDLQSQGSRNSAWQISGSNQLSGLESEGFVVLSGVRAVSESSRGRCCPGGNASKASGDLKGKASINILDGSESNLGDSEWIHNDELLISNLSTWNHIAKPNQTDSKNQPEQGFNQITKAKEKWLASSQCCKQQRGYGYDVAGKRTLTHTQFDSSKGPQR